MNVKFFDIYKAIYSKNKIFNLIKKLIKNNNFIGGYEVKKFEDNFSKFLGIKNTITVGNGTDALEIAIKSLNLKEGSEVIVPANTWISTAEAVVTNKLKLKFCDINLDDYTINIEDLKKKINKKTKLIIPVHLYGNAADMSSINRLAKENNIYILEDCAQAHGTMFGEKTVGTFGDIATFSFFPGKNLGAFGDAGAIVTNNFKLSTYCHRYKNHGSLAKYDHRFSGRNSRLDTIQAAILNVKLSDYKKVIKKRRLLANIYYQELADLNDIKLFNIKKKNFSTYHQFVIRTSFRDELQRFLLKKGIQTMIHYPYMLNELSFFKKTNSGKLINSKNLGKKILSLPISEEHSINEIFYICKIIKSFFNK